MAYENDMLVVLKVELAYLDQGRYDRVGSAAGLASFFEDSPICPNYGNQGDPVPCGQCRFMQYVDPKFRKVESPCHHIALDSEGHTYANLVGKTHPNQLKSIYRVWLVEKIAELEAARGPESEAERHRTFREST